MCKAKKSMTKRSKAEVKKGLKKAKEMKYSPLFYYNL